MRRWIRDPSGPLKKGGGKKEKREREKREEKKRKEKKKKEEKEEEKGENRGEKKEKRRKKKKRGEKKAMLTGARAARGCCRKPRRCQPSTCTERRTQTTKPLDAALTHAASRYLYDTSGEMRRPIHLSGARDI